MRSIGFEFDVVAQDIEQSLIEHEFQPLLCAFVTDFLLTLVLYMVAGRDVMNNPSMVPDDPQTFNSSKDYDCIEILKRL